HNSGGLGLILATTRDARVYVRARQRMHQRLHACDRPQSRPLAKCAMYSGIGPSSMGSSTLTACQGSFKLMLSCLSRSTDRFPSSREPYLKTSAVIVDATVRDDADDQRRAAKQRRLFPVPMRAIPRPMDDGWACACHWMHCRSVPVRAVDERCRR